MSATTETLEPSDTQSVGFAQSAFDQRMADIADPGPFREWRERAWTAYQDAPYPHRKDEPFRFATVRRATDEGYLLQPHDSSTASDLLQRSNIMTSTAGQLVFANDEVIDYQPVSKELQEKGVRFLPIRKAFEEAPELLEQHLCKERRDLGARKFRALHDALCTNGTLLYIPNNVVVEQPFVSYHWVQGDHSAIFPHTLFIAGDNAQATFIDYFASQQSEHPQFVSSAGLLKAGKNSHLNRLFIQNLNESSIQFHNEYTEVDRDSAPTSISVHLGGHYARHESALQIEGEGSSARLYGLTVGAGKQEFDQRTLQVHNAPQAYSDLLYKNALLEKARTIFSGMIRVEEVGQKTDAYQTNRNLQLSGDADANSLPGLEIEANDVKCSHGATTGRLDESELFYMMSRGIEPTEAKRLLVFGFFEEIVLKIPFQELADSLRDHVHAKFDTIRQRNEKIN